MPPLEYAPFVHLSSQSYAVLTDSGGIQEEAPALGKPVRVMRDVTERPKGVWAKTVKLDETPTEWVFNAHFVDLERDFTVSRVFRKKRRKRGVQETGGRPG